MKKLVVMLLACLGLTACNGNVVEPKGISRTYVNEDGYLMVVYTDGSEENAGYVKGEKGEQGIQGVAGTNGKDGVDGKDGLNGQDGKDGRDGETIIINTQPEVEEEYPLTINESEQVEEETNEEVEEEVYTFEWYYNAEHTYTEEWKYSTLFEARDGCQVTKNGYIVKDILFANPDKFAPPYLLDSDYNLLNDYDCSHYAGMLKAEYKDLNIENLQIKFRTAETTASGDFLTFYHPTYLRLKYTINKETYVDPGEAPKQYGYAGLQVYNNNKQTEEYKVGILDETVTSKELEDYILSLHPGYVIYAKDYSSFTSKYSKTKFTARKVYIRKAA